MAAAMPYTAGAGGWGPGPSTPSPAPLGWHPPPHAIEDPNSLNLGRRKNSLTTLLQEPPGGCTGNRRKESRLQDVSAVQVDVKTSGTGAAAWSGLDGCATHLEDKATRTCFWTGRGRARNWNGG